MGGYMFQEVTVPPNRLQARPGISTCCSLNRLNILAALLAGQAVQQRHVVSRVKCLFRYALTAIQEVTHIGDGSVQGAAWWDGHLHVLHDQFKHDFDATHGLKCGAGLSLHLAQATSSNVRSCASEPSSYHLPIHYMARSSKEVANALC